MADQERLDVIHGYLQDKFPESKTRDGHDFNRDAQVFTVAYGESVHYTAMVADELLIDETYNASDILSLLQKFRLAEELQKVENTNTRIIITSKGLRFEQEQ